MPRLGSLIPVTNDPLLLLLCRWTDIVGKQNRKVLCPREFDSEKKILRIAVPNSMVRAQYEPLLSLIVEKIGATLPEVTVEKIVLSVEPRCFERKSPRGEMSPSITRTPSSAEIAKARQRLIEKGVSPRSAAILAPLEVMREHTRDADT